MVELKENIDAQKRILQYSALERRRQHLKEKREKLEILSDDQPAFYHSFQAHHRYPIQSATQAQQNTAPIVNQLAGNKSFGGQEICSPPSPLSSPSAPTIYPLMQHRAPTTPFTSTKSAEFELQRTRYFNVAADGYSRWLDQQILDVEERRAKAAEEFEAQLEILQETLDKRTALSLAKSREIAEHTYKTSLLQKLHTTEYPTPPPIMPQYAVPHVPAHAQPYQFYQPPQYIYQSPAPLQPLPYQFVHSSYPQVAPQRDSMYQAVLQASSPSPFSEAQASNQSSYSSSPTPEPHTFTAVPEVVPIPFPRSHLSSLFSTDAPVHSKLPPAPLVSTFTNPSDNNVSDPTQLSSLFQLNSKKPTYPSTRSMSNNNEPTKMYTNTDKGEKSSFATRLDAILSDSTYSPPSRSPVQNKLPNPSSAPPPSTVIPSLPSAASYYASYLNMVPPLKVSPPHRPPAVPLSRTSSISPTTFSRSETLRSSLSNGSTLPSSPTSTRSVSSAISIAPKPTFTPLFRPSNNPKDYLPSMAAPLSFPSLPLSPALPLAPPSLLTSPLASPPSSNLALDNFSQGTSLSQHSGDPPNSRSSSIPVTNFGAFDGDYRMYNHVEHPDPHPRTSSEPFRSLPPSNYTSPSSTSPSSFEPPFLSSPPTSSPREDRGSVEPLLSTIRHPPTPSTPASIKVPLQVTLPISFESIPYKTTPPQTPASLPSTPPTIFITSPPHTSSTPKFFASASELPFTSPPAIAPSSPPTFTERETKRQERDKDSTSSSSPSSTNEYSDSDIERINSIEDEPMRAPSFSKINSLPPSPSSFSPRHIPKALKLVSRHDQQGDSEVSSDEEEQERGGQTSRSLYSVLQHTPPSTPSLSLARVSSSPTYSPPSSPDISPAVSFAFPKSSLSKLASNPPLSSPPKSQPPATSPAHTSPPSSPHIYAPNIPSFSTTPSSPKSSSLQSSLSKLDPVPSSPKFDSSPKATPSLSSPPKPPATKFSLHKPSPFVMNFDTSFDPDPPKPSRRLTSIDNIFGGGVITSLMTRSRNSPLFQQGSKSIATPELSAEFSRVSDDESKSEESDESEKSEFEESEEFEESAGSEVEDMKFNSHFSKPATTKKTLDVSKLGSAAGFSSDDVDDDEFDF